MASIDNYRYDMLLTHAPAQYLHDGHLCTREIRSHVALRELPPGQDRPWGGKTSDGPLVLVMEAAEDGPAPHAANWRPALRWPALGRTRARYRRKDRALTSKPRAPGSLAMRMAPYRGFSSAIRTISCWSSAEIRGRPGPRRFFRRQ